MMYCIHCGHSLPNEARFCSRCGKPIATIPTHNISHEIDNPSTNRLEVESVPSDVVMSPPERLTSHASGLSEDQLQRLAIGSNVAYYVPQIAHGQYRFNWVALFFPMIWFAYRKLYGSAFVILLIHTGMLAFAARATAGPAPESFLFLLMLAKPMVHFSAALVATERVLAQVNRVIGAANETSLRQDESVALLKAKGGTSWIAPILFLLAFAAASYLILTMLGMYAVDTYRFS